MLDWHIGLPEGLLVCWPPVQMEGRAGQCQLVSRIKTTHLFAEVSHNATGPKHGVCRGRRVGKGSCSGEVGVALVRASRGPPGLWPLPSPPPRHNISRSPFYRYLSFRGCQKPLPQCTEGSRQGGISTSAWVTDCRLGVGSSGGVEEWKSDWLLHMLRSGSGH